MARKKIGGLRESSVLQAMLWGPKHIRAADLTDPNVLENALLAQAAAREPAGDDGALSPSPAPPRPP